MKKLTIVPAFIFAALVVPSFAQEATLNTPITRASKAKIVVDSYLGDRKCTCGYVIVSFQDASGNDLEPVRYDFPERGVPREERCAGMRGISRRTALGRQVTRIAVRTSACSASSSTRAILAA